MASSGLYGDSLQKARRVLVAELAAFPINTTSIQYVYTLPVGYGKFRIEKVQVVRSAVLADSDGTMVVSVINYDASEAADDTLVSAADVEGGTAHVPADLTLATETSEKEFTMDEGDSLRVVFTNNSAAINTNGAISVLIFGHPVPNYSDQASVLHPSKY